jgi:transcriptional regulator with PAS, ATPase and Fis domain
MILPTGNKVVLEKPVTTEDAKLGFILKPGMTLNDMEKLAVVQALAFTKNDRTKAAKMLGLTTKGFYNKMHKHSLFERKIKVLPTRQQLVEACKKHGGQTKLAKEFGISRETVLRYIKIYKIETRRKRNGGL